MKNEMVCPKAQSGECKIKCDFGKPHNCKTSHPFSDHLTCIGYHGKNKRFALELKCVPVEVEVSIG